MKTYALTIAFLLVAATVQAQAPLSALWALDETMGTTAADGSINGNHGTLVNFAGNPWGPAVFGNGLSFDGIDDYVDCMQNGGLPAHGSGGTYSITGWVNALPQSDKRVYSEGSSTSNTPLFTLGSGTSLPNAMRVYIRNDTGSAVLAQQSTSAVFDGTWHHFAWVDDGNGGGILYVDGAADATDFSYTRSGTWTMDRVSLGAVLRAGTCCLLTGMLDDVRVYPFQLTGNDVTLIMGNGTLGTGFQGNQPAASLDLDGFTSSVSSAGRVNVAQGGQTTLNLSTNLGGFAWELATVTTPAIANGLILDPNNILNLPIGSATLANGFFTSTWGAPLALPGFPPTGYALSASVTYTAPMSPGLLTIQFGMMDPAAAGGYSLSGVAELNVQ